MTDEQIIEMAGKAGLYGLVEGGIINEFKAFAQLVAQHERAACVVVCFENADDESEGDWDSACINCANKILDRGEA